MSIETEVKNLRIAIEALTASISGGDFKIKLELPKAEPKPKAEEAPKAEPKPKEAPKLKVVDAGIEEERGKLITLLNDVSKKGHRKEAVEVLAGRKVQDIGLDTIVAITADLGKL